MNKLKKLLSLLLCLALIACMNTGMVSAEEIPEEDTQEPFYRLLSAEEEEAKEAASADAEEVLRAVEGEDYLSNEVIAFCESEEEAGKIAEAYEKSTGCDVAVDSFASNVALLKMYGTPDADKIREKTGSDSLNAVEAAVTIGASGANNLPAVYPNYIRYADMADTEKEDFTDPFLKQKKADGKDNEAFQWYHEKIGDKFVWKQIESDPDYLERLSNVKVAVLDTGINWEHPDFGWDAGTETGNVIFHKDYVEGKEIDPERPEHQADQEPYELAGGDTNGHGSNVAGIIGNVANVLGGRGVAPGVKLLSFRVLGRWGSGADVGILRALEDIVNPGDNAALSPEEKTALNGVKVVNMSLGGGTYTTSYLGVFAKARANNILVIASAGNNDTSARAYPGAYEDTLCVAALNSDYEKASFSNYGDWVDLSAPGGDYRQGADYPGFWFEEELYASGPGEDPEKIPEDNRIGKQYKDEWGNCYINMAGTSQAAPVVSGCAALLFAKEEPSYSRDTVQEILQRTARPLTSAYKLGAGCVNIAEAMEMEPEVPAPEADVASGEVVPGTPMELSVPGDFSRKAFSVIKYTLNGKIPCDPNTPEEEVYTFLEGEDYLELKDINGTGELRITAQTLVYGKAGPCATFVYTFDRTLTGIRIVSPGGSAEADVAEGKTIALQAVLEPAYTASTDVIWSVEDPAVATVDQNGTVKGLNRGETTVTATVPGTEISAQKIVHVKEGAEAIQFEFSALHLESGEVHPCSEGEVAIYPASATDLYTLTSSDEKIAKVEQDAEGNYSIAAIAPGQAVLCATTADGTGFSATVPVKVYIEEPEEIEIYDPAGYFSLTEKRELVPGVIFDGSKKGSPAEEGLEWNVLEGGEIVAFTEEGYLQVTREVSEATRVKIRAKMGETESNELELMVCPLMTQEDLKINQELLEDPFLINRSIGLYDIFKIENDQVLDALEFSCSNKTVMIDQDKGIAFFTKAGSFTITAKAIDGSDVKASAKVKAEDEDPVVRGLGFQAGYSPAVCPGGTTALEVIMSKKSTPPSGKYMIPLEDQYAEEDDYVKIKGNKVIGQITDEMEEVDPGTPHTIAWGMRTYSDGRWVFDERHAIAVELYPVAVEEIVLSFAGEDDVAGRTFLLEPGEVNALDVTEIKPAEACQKYYTFKSSNPKVATVDENGIVRSVAKGKATITVTAGDGSQNSAKINLEVARYANSVEIGSKTGSFSVAPGKTLNLTATVLPDHADNKKVSWSVVSGPATIGATNGTLKAGANAEPGNEVTVRAEVLQNGTVLATGEKSIHIAAETSGIAVDEEQVKKSGLTVYTTDAGSCRKKAEFSVTVTAKADGLKAEPVVSSSKDCLTVALKETENLSERQTRYTYEVSAASEKAGNAVITVAAVDGSKKKVSVKAALLVPVTSISIEGKGGLTAITPGKTLTMVATANKDAKNKKVTWDFAPGVDVEELEKTGIDVNRFRRTGQIYMKKNAEREAQISDDMRVFAKATDGSGTISGEFLIGIRPKAVSAVQIAYEHGDTEKKPVKETTLGLRRVPADEMREDGFRLSRAFVLKIETGGEDYPEYQYAPITVTSSNEKIVKARIENYNGILGIYTYDVVTHDGTDQTGTATVTVKAADGSAKYATLKVKVGEPVREILLSADKPTRKIGANGKLKMKATVDQRATNKKVSWKLYDMDSHEITATDQIATISASGELKPYAKLAERKKVQVYAVATDGTPTSSKPEMISLYPAQGAITFSKIEEGEDPEVISRLEIDAGGYAEVMITGVEKSLMDYQVTYQTGPVNVAYVTVSDDGTQIYITGLKPGASTITATARDGSGKKAKLKVTVK